MQCFWQLKLLNAEEVKIEANKSYEYDLFFNIKEKIAIRNRAVREFGNNLKMLRINWGRDGIQCQQKFLKLTLKFKTPKTNF